MLEEVTGKSMGVMPPEVLVDKFQGALLGTHVGDALGMAVEGWGADKIRRTYGEVRDMIPARRGRGTYTDDTEMTIALAASLIRCRGFSGEDVALSFVEHYNPSRGYGPGTTRVLLLLKSGVAWSQAAGMVFSGRGSFGNGAAMRVAPVGLLYHDRLEELRRVAELSAAVTHGHFLGREGAAIQAYAVALAVRAKPGDLDRDKFLRSLADFVHPEAQEFREKLAFIGELLAKDPRREEVVRLLGNDVRAAYSVPAAIYSFLRFPESFEEAVVYAVGLGGDTDTIGAMTGAIAGAYHGRAGIPVRWLEVLEGGCLLEDLGRALWELYREEFSRAGGG